MQLLITDNYALLPGQDLRILSLMASLLDAILFGESEKVKQVFKYMLP